MNNLKTALLISSICTLAACSPSTPPSTSPTTPLATAPASVPVPTTDNTILFERTILTATGDTLGTLSLKDLGEGGTEVTVTVSGLDGAGTQPLVLNPQVVILTQ
jgi:Cu-Zn family superoxide dismutase